MMHAIIPDTRDCAVSHATIEIRMAEIWGEASVWDIGMMMLGADEEDCPLCRAGVCQQRYVLGAYDDEPIVIHGMAGDA